MNNKPISRKSNIVVQDLENEVLIYDLIINKAFCLNQTSGLVFSLCDGTRTVTEISTKISSRLNTLISEDLVYLALDDLRKNNLLEKNEEITDHFAGMSRREVVKKVGLASMALLPVIASLIAPSAAMSASGALLGLIAVCTSPLDCQSNNCFLTTVGAPDPNRCCASSTTNLGVLPGTGAAVPLGTDCATVCCSGNGVNILSPDGSPACGCLS